MSRLYKKGVLTVTDCTGDKGFTNQSQRDEADINTIIKRFEKGGNLVRLNSREPFYGDVSEFDGLEDAMIKVQKAESLFMEYDASIRERFDNDPRKFVKFLEDSNNMEEAVKLGLVLPRHAEPPPTPPPAG